MHEEAVRKRIETIRAIVAQNPELVISPTSSPN
jgi:hypothetical protein